MPENYTDKTVNIKVIGVGGAGNNVVDRMISGGIGTGAAPIIADLAHEAGLLTVGIVTKPFRFEGANRRKQAEAGIASLFDKVDSLIIISNDRLKYVTDQKITFSADVLKQAVSAICGCTTFQKTSSDERGMPDAKN